MKKEIQFLLCIAMITLTGCNWHNDDGKSSSEHGFFVVKQNTPPQSILAGQSSEDKNRLKVSKNTALTVRPKDASLTIIDVTQGRLGDVVLRENKKEILYTPHTDLTGKDSFTYTAMDTNETVFEAKVLIEIVE